MSETSTRTRMTTQLRTGTKVCLILAALLVIASVYAYLVPINMPTAQGVFGCGSAIQPPTDPFAKGVCQDLAGIQQLRAICLAAASAVVAGLGSAFFGADRVSRAQRLQERDPAALDVD